MFGLVDMFLFSVTVYCCGVVVLWYPRCTMTSGDQSYQISGDSTVNDSAVTVTVIEVVV